jgi:charged multivesicular body protein 5
VLLVVDKKINDLDNELRKYKVQLKTASGPTAANIKKRAMDVLKRKVGSHCMWLNNCFYSDHVDLQQRMYEQQRDQMANQQFNVDQTSFAIETVRSTQTTIAVMKTAAKTLKKENKKIDLSELENMQDEMEGMHVGE